MGINTVVKLDVARKWFTAMGMLVLLTMLTACGEDAFLCNSDDCDNGSGTTTTTTTTTTTVSSSGVQIGNGTGAAFQVGSISIDNTALTTGGSANLSVSLVNADQTAYATSTTINFSASCASSTINPNPTGTSGGVANVVYVAGSCSGPDTITATASVDGSTLTATGTITISVPVTNTLFGSGSTTTFVQGALALGTGDVLGAGDPPLSAGGSTTVLATIVDGDAGNALITTATGSVTFSSPCEGSGNATISSPVSFANGVAQATYVATGCSGDDLITATTVVDGNVLTATATITVAPASIGSIQFVSANPTTIALAGTGGGGLQETSTLTFNVLDNNGDAVANQIVNFSLNTTVGGISLSSASGVTGSSGAVTVIVQSGTISTPVKVTASTTDVNSGITYTTQSDALVVSTGLADDNSFSMSIGDCNPAGAWETDGVQTSVQILAADHFNNPVPDGTAISFTTEGGSIVGSCQTSGGACSVTWTSQAPRPANSRVTILATAIGNESFLDSNSNGGYDNSDPIFSTIYPDLPEAWRDDNENGVFDSGSEEFVDFNQDGVYTGADGGYTGVLCNHTTNCATATSLHVYEIGVIGMASNSNSITIDGGAGANADFGPLPATTASPLSVDIDINSATGQFPATGTSITVETTNGVILGTSSFTVPNTCGTAIGQPYSVTVQMQSDGTPSTGVLTVKASTGGIETIRTVLVSD